MPIQRATENTVREAPMSGNKLQAADFNAGEIYGRALEGFGKQMGQVVEEVDKVVYQYDLAAAKNADTEDAIELARIRAEALNAKGVDAETATETARNEANELKKRRLSEGGLKGRRAELYSTAFDQRLVNFETQITDHAVAQADVAFRGAALASADNSLKLAVDGYTDPEVYRTNMDDAYKQFVIGNSGATPEQLEAKWREATSRTHVSIAGLMMDADPLDPNPEKVVEWLEDHRSEILGDHLREIYKSLGPLRRADMVTTETARADTMGGILEGGGDYDIATGEIKSPKEGEVEPEKVSGVVGATSEPGVTPKGLDPKAPVASATGAKPTTPKAAEPYRNSVEVFNHVVGRGYRVTDTSAEHVARGSQPGIDLAIAEGTAIHPPMSGEVLDKGWDPVPTAGGKGGGWWMTVKHSNGLITGYAHMKMDSPLKRGDHVEKTDIIGAVGQTGKASGPHLHFTVREGGGKVDPQSVQWNAMADSGGPPLKDPATVSWKEGDLVITTAEKDTLSKKLNRINLVAQKEGWSQFKYDLIVDEAKSRAALSDKAYTEGYNALKDRVNGQIAAIEKGGGRFTDVAQLGSSFGKLDGTDQLQITRMANAGKKAVETGEDIPTYGDEFVDWSRMSNGSPDEQELFLKQDFRNNHLMPPSERFKLQERQDVMNKDVDGRLAASTAETISIIDRYASSTGFVMKEAKEPKETAANKEDKRRYILLQDRVLTRIQTQQRELKRELTPLEKETIVKSQVIAVNKDGQKMPLYIYQTTPGLQAKPGQLTVNPDELWGSIPQLVKDSIIQGLVDRGERPTPRAVMNEYIRGL